MAHALPLGRRKPTDFVHVERFPFATVAPATVDHVDLLLRLPTWHWRHDQGREGSCVGHGIAMERAITNTAQNRLLAFLRPGRRYDPISIWNEGKMRDEWPDTNPGDDNGTSVRAGYDGTREVGARRVRTMRMVDGVPEPVYFSTLSEADPAAGVEATRWATTVDEIRTAISLKIPVAIGIDWYDSFDSPQKIGLEWRLPDATNVALGSIRGGHCVCIYGASDNKQAFRFKNSWGTEYPLAWIPYATMGKLLADDGEAALVTDR